MGRNIILKDLQDSIIYSVMVDSTQDIAVMDQLAICVRYVVQGKVYERLLEIAVVNDSSGLALYELIKLKLSEYGIAMSNIIACSFDGANNMKGCYNGLQAYLKKENKDLIYTHCMAHVLNLVVADSTVKLLQAENLFGLVEESALFLSSSHKRMAVWEKETKRKHTAHDKFYRVQKIEATRWWSKHKALSSIVDEEFLINCARMSIEERFCANKDVLQDCSWLDPKKFDSILKLETFPTEALRSVSKLCKIERSRLLMELRQFAQQYSNFIAAESTENYGDRCNDEEDDLDPTEESEKNADIYCSKNRQCFQCLTCAFSVLFELTQSGLFTNLYIAYKFILAIPCTQVTCQRVFSKLKIVKN
ncbi:unnamed protein product [Brassicogethes aeneus]|uniref:DUF4371 domain-containing protein n=1 Tax=Brassicogethes aeneus TaxID=1431903 RepID=A0A9P0FJQ7_BRAAE|nr:unnamed protein product [Brassicogethes aeneus]